MGDHRDLPDGRGRLYGEKIIVVREGQFVPHHYHASRPRISSTAAAACSRSTSSASIGPDGGRDGAFELDRDGLAVEARSGDTITPVAGRGDDPRSRHRACLPRRGRAMSSAARSRSPTTTRPTTIFHPASQAAAGRSSRTSRRAGSIVADYATFDRRKLMIRHIVLVRFRTDVPAGRDRRASSRRCMT